MVDDEFRALLQQHPNLVQGIVHHKLFDFVDIELQMIVIAQFDKALYQLLLY